MRRREVKNSSLSSSGHAEEREPVHSWPNSATAPVVACPSITHVTTTSNKWLLLVPTETSVTSKAAKREPEAWKRSCRPLRETNLTLEHVLHIYGSIKPRYKISYNKELCRLCSTVGHSTGGDMSETPSGQLRVNFR